MSRDSFLFEKLITSSDLPQSPSHCKYDSYRKLDSPCLPAQFKWAVLDMPTNARPKWPHHPLQILRFYARGPVSYTHLTLPTICSV
eukprot:10005154-Alexandrium_andersonii.AAC.1